MNESVFLRVENLLKERGVDFGVLRHQPVFTSEEAAKGQNQISLRELMDMCLDGSVEGLDLMMSPLLRVYGVGKIGFWSVVNSLTNLDLGCRCNEEWQKRLMAVKQQWRITAATPYSSCVRK